MINYVLNYNNIPHVCPFYYYYFLYTYYWCVFRIILFIILARDPLYLYTIVARDGEYTSSLAAFFGLREIIDTLLVNAHVYSVM